MTISYPLVRAPMIVFLDAKGVLRVVLADVVIDAFGK